MPSDRPITVLHLSDMQFGRHHRFGRLGAPPPDDEFDSLFTRVTDDLKLLKKDHGLWPDLLVLSGDLAEWGRKAEFDDALLFAQKLTDFLGLPRGKVVIVPRQPRHQPRLLPGLFPEVQGGRRKPAAAVLAEVGALRADVPGVLRRRTGRHVHAGGAGGPGTNLTT